MKTNKIKNITTLLIFFILIQLSFSTSQKSEKTSYAQTSQHQSSFDLEKFISSFTTIFFSGLADKSFWITTFLSMKHNKFIVFLSALSAWTVQGLISIQFGKILPNYISETYLNIFSGLLFIAIGGYFVINAYFSDESNHEIDKEEAVNYDKWFNGQNKGINIFFECFGLVFISEFGDKSQIAMICLSTNTSVIVAFSSVSFANLLLTGLAIGCGKIVAERISKRWLEMISGVLFIIFGWIFWQESFGLMEGKVEYRGDISLLTEKIGNSAEENRGVGVGDWEKIKNIGNWRKGITKTNNNFQG